MMYRSSFVYIAARNVYISERPTDALCVPKDSTINVVQPRSPAARV